jgi:hypothetical protein
MAEHIEPEVIGQIRDARGRKVEEPTYVTFDSTGYCCEGCTEGHESDTTRSFQPVELTVAWRDDLPPGAMAIEIRWTTAGAKPQTLVMDSWAADALASAVHRAHYGVGGESK